MSDPDIRKWDGINGMAKEDRLAAFLESQTDAYAILQLRDSDETAMERFMSLAGLNKQGREVDIDHYEVVYVGGLLPYQHRSTMLEQLYTKFNIDHPSDFRGHSLSVSDIVALNEAGNVSCHYVDTIGFKELPGFLKPENYLKSAEMTVEDDYGMVDGIINNGRRDETDMGRSSVVEQLKEFANEQLPHERSAIQPRMKERAI